MEDTEKWEDRHPVSDIAVVDSSPASMMQAAISGGMDLEKLEKFMELQEKYELREAKKAYHQAMAQFKENPPEIEKDRHVSFGEGKTSYSHASLANVTKKINSGLSKHGLSATWVTTQNNGSITVTCKITHQLGHSEETALTASPDTSGSKNSIQAIGSTISYLERYTLLALTGLATFDMDDDGKETEVEYLTEKQVKEIEKIITDKKVDQKKFLEYMKAEKVTEILARDFSKATVALKAAKGQVPPKINCPELDGKARDKKDCDSCAVRVGCPEHDE